MPNKNKHTLLLFQTQFPQKQHTLFFIDVINTCIVCVCLYMCGGFENSDGSSPRGQQQQHPVCCCCCSALEQPDQDIKPLTAPGVILRLIIPTEGRGERKDSLPEATNNTSFFLFILNFVFLLSFVCASFIPLLSSPLSLSPPTLLCPFVCFRSSSQCLGDIFSSIHLERKLPASLSPASHQKPRALDCTTSSSSSSSSFQPGREESVFLPAELSV